jgi:ArsR family transcriptional regulator, arsenate/arsenite/antimonite-responsive transcriptional repressor
LAGETETGAAARMARLRESWCCSGIGLPIVPDEASRTLASLGRAMADETRVGILSLLARYEEPVCVCEVVAAFALGQPTISHHLRILRESGLVDSEKKGLWVFYHLNRDSLAQVRAYLDELLAAPQEKRGEVDGDGERRDQEGG